MNHLDDPKWVPSGWGYKVKSPDDLMRAVGRVGTLQVGRRYVWRGVADWRWRVQSSLIRSLMTKTVDQTLPSEQKVRAREMALITAAREWGLGREPSGVASDLQVLASLQHHGIPTRLLDVTTNPMTAMWFACQSRPEGRDAAGAVMAFDVTGLESLPTATSELPPTYGSLEDPLGWHLRHQLEVSARDNKPFLVEPSFPDPRMRAQEGLFLTGAVPQNPDATGVDGIPLIGGGGPPGQDALDVLFAPAVRKQGRPRSLPFVVFVIPTNSKRKMRQHLETTFNRTYRHLFPDLAGFAAAVRDGAISMLDDPPSADGLK